MKGGSFRGFVATLATALAATNMFGLRRLKKTRYPDPVLRAPLDGFRGSGGRYRSGLKKKKVMPCEPGTIRYHDKLVRHFGRRQADKYGRIIRAGQLDLLPTAEDFANNPPWAFLASR